MLFRTLTPEIRKLFGRSKSKIAKKEKKEMLKTFLI